MSRAGVTALLALPLGLFAAAGCARNEARATADVQIQVPIQVKNNLRFPLSLRALLDSVTVWSSGIAAGATLDGRIGPLPSEARISLVALDDRGNVVTRRDGVSLQKGALIWTIP
jgi:hypothetical protein